MMPPGIEKDWDNNPPWMQAYLIAYEQVRQHEESEQSVAMIKSMVR